LAGKTINASLLSEACRLKLHYYLRDNAHRMDANVRNRCEHELLEIVKEFSETIGFNLVIESEAFAEGGLKEFWTFLGGNHNQIGLLLMILTIILSRLPTSNSKLEKLQIEDLQISIKERELNIELLKKQLKESKEPSSNLDFEKAATLLQTPQVERHKSNFYKNLQDYDKVTSISTTIMTEFDKPANDEQTVNRSEFSKFVLTTAELSRIVDENARIQIISPVLKDENYKWRGLYDNNPIEFYMKDKDFKNSVIGEGVQFKNGTTIDCLLEINRKTNETGEIYFSSYSVVVVFRKRDDNITVETPQGIRYLKDKKEMDSQLNLFDTIP
jgi:hypothetical protein